MAFESIESTSLVVNFVCSHSLIFIYIIICGLKNQINIPIINKYIPNMYESLDIEFRVSLIYSLILKDKGDDFLKREYRNKPVIYD